jgi:hypothetical protein
MGKRVTPTVRDEVFNQILLGTRLKLYRRRVARLTVYDTDNTVWSLRKKRQPPVLETSVHDSLYSGWYEFERKMRKYHLHLPRHRDLVWYLRSWKHNNVLFIDFGSIGLCLDHRKGCHHVP